MAVCVYVCVWERERQTDRDRQRETLTPRVTHIRETYSGTDIISFDLHHIFLRDTYFRTFVHLNPCPPSDAQNGASSLLTSCSPNQLTAWLPWHYIIFWKPSHFTSGSQFTWFISAVPCLHRWKILFWNP